MRAWKRSAFEARGVRAGRGGKALCSVSRAFAWLASSFLTVLRLTRKARLIARREKLFQDLIRLETDRKRGRGDSSRYAVRREELIAALEHVYGALDSDDIAPEPTGGAGVAA